MTSQSMKSLIASYDANKDGRLSREEFFDAVNKVHKVTKREEQPGMKLKSYLSIYTHTDSTFRLAWRESWTLVQCH